MASRLRSLLYSRKKPTDMKSSSMRLFLGGILALGLVCGAGAQNITATLTGTVTDPSGALVPAATVTVHNNATGQERTATTDATGVYTLAQLPAGDYTVTVAKSGFQQFVAKDVILHVGDHRGLDVTLKTGEVSQTVEVTTSAVPIQTATAAQSETITGNQIRQLQLNNRNFEQLVTLQPGVSSSLPALISFGITNTDNVSVNGERSSANNWTVDGSDINDSGSNQTLLNVPSVDALQEFEIERSTYDAEYGRSGGGQINVDQERHQPAPRRRLRVPAQRQAGRQRLLSQRRRREAAAAALQRLRLHPRRPDPEGQDVLLLVPGVAQAAQSGHGGRRSADAGGDERRLQRL